ncbi:unnamed protein product [Cuscuta campestris]|uniref:30S ribosomal protein S9, chloroplastic n=1 Tax=Cuscuta campestris TaxID=132261 RepID=A0A484LEK0_9ASTE|nr:unnamed protein product [Cuscuta campestris]
MLSRFLCRPSHLRFIISRNTHFLNPKIPSPHAPISSSVPVFFPKNPHFFSTSNNGGGSDSWNLSSSDTPSMFPEDIEISETLPRDESPLFRDLEEPEKGTAVAGGGFVKGFSPWTTEEDEDAKNVFEILDEEDEKGKWEVGSKGGRGENGEWETAAGYKPWSASVEEDGETVFDVVEEEEKMAGLDFSAEEERLQKEKLEEEQRLELEEKALTVVLKGPNRAFGDLIAASGITEEMLDSLMTLKDLGDIKGLPPLHEIEDMRYERSMSRSSRAEMERQKQEEVAKARVRQVDEKGRAYGTGKRKCSIARVWIEPGNGKFIVNDKEFDVYFPMLDHRANLLRPFSETTTLGMWDVRCTVKGGGVSGQAGAIQLGISRALQNWDPELRRPLREAGFLTRDSRVVERKKPGRAKARKSFQWVKR